MAVIKLRRKGKTPVPIKGHCTLSQLVSAAREHRPDISKSTVHSRITNGRFSLVKAEMRDSGQKVLLIPVPEARRFLTLIANESKARIYYILLHRLQKCLG